MTRVRIAEIFLATLTLCVLGGAIFLLTTPIWYTVPLVAGCLGLGFMIGWSLSTLAER